MKKFNPTIYQCTQCDDYIWSRYPGHWSGCCCGQSYVDQTSHYVRLGGFAELVGPYSKFRWTELDKDDIRELWEETKFAALDKMEAKLKKVESIDLETMEIVVEVTLPECPEKVWWEEQEERWGE